jgi:hypothetical protein
LLLGLVLAALLLPLVLLPLSVIQRYRVGTARRPARVWVANLNIGGFLLAAGVVVVTAGITALWAPSALPATSAGLCAGALFGLIGLSLSKWETRAGHLYFTPNRWLVGALTLLVVARLGYGAWRFWQAWVAWGGEAGWLASTAASGSLAAGALLIGYGLGFWSAVRWRIARRKAAMLMQI